MYGFLELGACLAVFESYAPVLTPSPVADLIVPLAAVANVV